MGLSTFENPLPFPNLCSVSLACPQVQVAGPAVTSGTVSKVPHPLVASVFLLNPCRGSSAVQCLWVWALDSHCLGSNPSSDIYLGSVFFIWQMGIIITPALRVGADIRCQCLLCAKKLLSGHYKLLLSLERVPHFVSRGHGCTWILSPLEFRCLVEGKDNIFIFASSKCSINVLH